MLTVDQFTHCLFSSGVCICSAKCVYAVVQLSTTSSRQPSWLNQYHNNTYATWVVRQTHIDQSVALARTLKQKFRCFSNLRLLSSVKAAKGWQNVWISVSLFCVVQQIDQYPCVNVAIMQLCNIPSNSRSSTYIWIMKYKDYVCIACLTVYGSIH